MRMERSIFLTKKTIAEQVADLLREEILRAEIAPGERVIEEEVAKKLAVSRGPVREALRLLQEEGLVTYVPRKGCEVTILSHEQMEEAYLIRSTLEELAVSLCDGKIAKKSLQQMENAIGTMEIAAKNKDLYGVIMADEEFHGAIVASVQKDRLFHMWKSLVGANTASFYTMNTKDLMPYASVCRNHRFLLKLFLQPYPCAQIQQAIKEHYMAVPDTLLQSHIKKK